MNCQVKYLKRTDTLIFLLTLIIKRILFLVYQEIKIYINLYFIMCLGSLVYIGIFRRKPLSYQGGGEDLTTLYRKSGLPKQLNKQIIILSGKIWLNFSLKITISFGSVSCWWQLCPSPHQSVPKSGKNINKMEPQWNCHGGSSASYAVVKFYLSIILSSLYVYPSII